MKSQRKMYPVKKRIKEKKTDLWPRYEEDYIATHAPASSRSLGQEPFYIPRLVCGLYCSSRITFAIPSILENI